MRKKLLVLLMVVAISSSLLLPGLVQAQDQANSEDLFSVLNKLDIAASSLRKGDADSAKASMNAAFLVYENKFSPEVTEVDVTLDNQIIDDFTVYSQSPTEADILSLRSEVSRAAELIGVELSPLFQYAIFLVIGLSFAVALFTTLVSKKMVDWKQFKESKTKISEYNKELREAQRKRDMKQVYKLQQRQSEIMKLNSAMMSQNMKPTLIIMVVLLPMWFFISGIFHGWVVAWLPFNLDLPFVGKLVVFGMGWWYFLNSLAFSQILRKILIGD